MARYPPVTQCGEHRLNVSVTRAVKVAHVVIEVASTPQRLRLVTGALDAQILAQAGKTEPAPIIMNRGDGEKR